MNPRIVHLVIKMSVAFALSYLIASLFQLTYSVTAGILAVLSIQMTKKDTLQMATKRLFSAAIALTLSSLLFFLLGYHVGIFMVFVPLFALLSYALGMQMGIVPSLVLVNHLLIHQTFSWSVVFDTMLLLAIASTIAFLINIVYPSKSKSNLLRATNEMDRMLSDHILMLSFLLKNKDDPSDFIAHYRLLKPQVTQLINWASLEEKDILFQENRQSMAYLFMRETQFQTIDRMYELAMSIQDFHPNMMLLADFLKELSSKIGQYNQAKPQKEKLHVMMEAIRKEPLPLSRNEFETRAILFQIIREVDFFLLLKLDYHKKYGEG